MGKEGWDITKEKAVARLELLNNTKAAWEGYYAGLENIAVEFEKAEEEIKKVKKRFHLQSAVDDLAKRQKIFTDTKGVIDGMFNGKVDKLEQGVIALKNFDETLKFVDKWMKEADGQLDQIKNHSDKMTPEDRVSCTMELQEDVGEKVRIIQDAIKTEADLLPQGDQVPKDAQDYKDELKRIEEYVLDLQ